MHDRPGAEGELPGSSARTCPSVWATRIVFEEQFGAVAGLAVVSGLSAFLSSLWWSIGTIATLALVAALVLRALFPETAGRKREEIAPHASEVATRPRPPATVRAS